MKKQPNNKPKKSKTLDSDKAIVLKKDGITKTVKSEESYFIEFTDEEMDSLGIKPHDKFEIITNDDNSIILKKFEKLDIDLQSFDKETLAYLIQESIENQIPADEVIRNVITSYLKHAD